ncbi:unnamed protein product [Phaedon cochleariae]|uniref:ATP-grasp domain-containing protein n=1 Tax=Phaedon cochleariae TaxID=80249 RepID=A0A9P0GVI6_PHACE|nr:unnamed protein product [Phaedon cochleariae]
MPPANQKAPVKKTTNIAKCSKPSDPLAVLENEIGEVAGTCRSFLKEIKEGKGKSQANTNVKYTQKKGYDSFEKVTDDISKILDTLEYLNSVKDKNDSYSDVLPSLEKKYREQMKQYNEIKTAKNPPKTCNPKKNNMSIKNANVKNPNVNSTTKSSCSTMNSTVSSKKSDNEKNFKEKSKSTPIQLVKNEIAYGEKTRENKKSVVPASQNFKTSITVKNIQNTNALTKPTSIKPDSTTIGKKPSQLRSLKAAGPTPANKRILPICPSKKSNMSNSGSTRQLIEPQQINLNQQLMSTNPLLALKQEVDKAIQERKTFTVRGNFRGIRRALLNRGWVEKVHLTQRELMNTELRKFCTYSIPELLNLVRNKEIADICRRLIKSKLLTSHQVDLYYSSSYDAYKECPDKVKQTMINRIRWISFSYTNKGGLTEASRKSFWYHIPGVSNLNHPRSYKLTKNGDTEEFVKDFNLTAAMSMIKWVKMNSETQLCKILSTSGKIPLRVFDFAINECYKFIKKAKHEDIDQEIQEALSHEWNDFLEYFYKTVHTGNHFKQVDGVSESDLVRKATFILDKLKEHWPYLEMDGLMNIWILKPMNSSQGVGIHMCRTLNYVLQTIKTNENRRYIIQKYIERPMLIYNTKFDIRQWFFISTCVPLTIWMYKQCYLRFSSQTYNLRKLHESIHLTNNSVQSKYNRVTSKDISLPSYNMWDSNQFKNYLSDIGYPKAFAEIIYPGMKESITAAVLMHQDSIDRRAASFELYGADFMVTEDFKPWLLEINSNPALQASTPITARMCPNVLEDVIRVLVDYKNDKNASTGGFELLYREQPTPRRRPGELEVAGTPLKPEFFNVPLELQEKSSFPPESTKNKPMQQVTCIKELGKSIRHTLHNLLELLKQERLKRSRRKHIGIETILSCTEIVTESVETILSDTMIK